MVVTFNNTMRDCRNYVLFIRDIYGKRARKATGRKRRNRDLSVVVDGAGGAGTKNQPRMITQEKNEPPRQKMLKTNWTFCVVVLAPGYIAHTQLLGNKAAISLWKLFTAV